MLFRSEYFEKLGNEPERWGKPFAALLGALIVQDELKIPAIGGKDSMSGTFKDIDVPPTLISFAVAVSDAKHVISSEFKKQGSTLIHITAGRDSDNIIEFEQYRKNMEELIKLMSEGKILAADTIGKGGIFATVFRMAVGNRIGAKLFDVSEQALCNIDCGGLVIEINNGYDVKELLGDIKYKILGNTTSDERLIVNESEYKLSELTVKWCEPLEKIGRAHV